MASASLIADAVDEPTTRARRAAGPAARGSRPGHRARERRRNLWIYAFLLPTFVLYGMYTLYPMVASYWYSLVEWNGFTADQRFVGLANYEKVLADPQFWSSVKVTMLFMLVVAPLRVFGAFALAILLNSPRLPFTGFFRTAFFIPVVTTTAIVGVVMRFIFDPASGPVAGVLSLLGRGPVDLLGSTDTALVTAGIVYVWKFFGITLIYWLAALQTIPQDLYEAARIDGASRWRQTWHVTLPGIRPTMVTLLILNIGTFMAVGFEKILLLYNPLTYPTADVISTYLYRMGFQSSNFSYAAAIGLFEAVIGLTLVMTANAISRRTVGTSLW